MLFEGLILLIQSKTRVKPGFCNNCCHLVFPLPQWTVNGQLRVGFFTTKLVPSGSELTFDYQFQRYGYVSSLSA